ncbi:hypothetical protein BCR32DRAFT_230078 [Anaeromyces robustus]|uniref:DUF814-domain-containing protein n=1 Tax=Anaeromyces robustus TaxID=1754192 RepID=A0A1Y1XI29_9FUNG|nr:hypothetical protein BCR32DRAFT_230078 [Anaeromyces robustus]|eukprot:ORX85024.1 hypothetical protein BCR32DRAFT_230078 [Anaeromyces robustus]
MKKRFSFLDVAAVVLELQKKLLNLRLSNIYDINPKTYLLKFARNEVKEFLIVESGVRFHTTNYSRQKENTRSIFAMKLRKHIRTRRLTSIKQLGTDRIVDLCFGEDEASYHLILEFYSSGNIILTDNEYKILSLLRTVSVDEKDKNERTRFAVGEIYDISQAKSHAPVTIQDLQKVLRPEEEDSNNNKEKDNNDSSIEISIVSKKQEIQRDQKAPMTKKEKRRLKEMKLKQEQKQKEEEQKKQQNQNKKQKERNIKNITLLRCIKEKFSEKYGPALIDHIIKKSNLNPSLKVFTEFDISPESPQMRDLFKAFNEADEIVNSINNNENKGYIISHRIESSNKKKDDNENIVNEDNNDNENKENNNNENVIYDEFHPYLFSQFENRVNDVITFPTFNEAVDEYYSKLEAQQMELKKKNTENAAQKKLDNVRRVQEDRIKGLEEACERSVEMAQAIEANQDYVDQLIQLIRSFIASGMDWVDLDNMLAEERKRNNPVALAIKELKLINGMVSVELLTPESLYNMDDDSDDDSDEDSDEDNDESEEDEDEDESKKSKKSRKDNNKKKTIVVDIDIYSSAYANARRYYDMKRSASAKQEKTIQAAEKALKSAEKKIAKEMNISKMPIAPSIVKVRKPYWFEKFHWFISSENYLVLAGRDALQNEQLVRKYLRKGDIYIHADIHGASTVIVKNTNPMGETKATIASGECPIPPTTLLQAATMAVCYSKAWDSKVVTSAYWVYDHQVSKTAPSGEYLTTGSFMIRGKKNWLPVVQLVYGFGFLFRIEDSNIPRHYWERRPWGRDIDETDEAISKKIALKREKQREALLSLNQVEDVDDNDQENLENENEIDNNESKDIKQKEKENENENENEDENEDENEESISDKVEEEDDQENKDSNEVDNEKKDYEEEEDSESKIENEKEEEDDDGEEGEEGEEELDNDDDDDDDEDFEFPDTQIEAPQLLTTQKQKDEKMMQDMKERYNLNEIEHEEDVTETNESLQSSGRKHISANERRQLRRKKRQEKKMNKLLEASEEGTTGTSTPNDSTNEFASDGNEDKRKKKGKKKGNNNNNNTKNSSALNKLMSNDSTVANILQSNVRGKKGKIKKLKEKYLDQDEEERLIRMALTGAISKKETKKNKKGNKKDNKQNQKALAFMSSANNSSNNVNNKSKNENNNNNNNNKNKSNLKSPITAQQEKEEIQQLLKDENIPILEEEQLESLMMLDELTGQPDAKDELLYAIPVCAPWSCLQKYKYRVKLLPGSVKKGKLVRSITSNFVQMPKALDREKELLMSVHENEMIGVIGLSKCEMVNENSSIGSTKKKNKRSK